MLRAIDLCWADLRATVLRRANLAGADLSRADLRKANLIGADLERANLFGADLRKADLGMARLSSANLSYANLEGAHIARASFGGTILEETNLRGVHGLRECIHLAPSTVPSRTVAKSEHMPAGFLRGCGISDAEIEFAKLQRAGLSQSEIVDIGYRLINLRSGPAILYSCFISYSTRDGDFASKLHNDLQRNGVRCWFAPEDMKIGDEVRATIDEAIRMRDKVLLVLSAHAIESEWVKDEVESAFELEKVQQKSVLFPVRLDESVFNTANAWAGKLRRQRHIGDFSAWNDSESYEESFRRLLRDLRSSELNHGDQPEDPTYRVTRTR